MSQVRKVLSPDETRGWRPSAPGGQKPPPKPAWLKQDKPSSNPASSARQTGNGEGRTN